ncbi:MAG: PAS-domain containing protein [Xanthobacteraceae bacterium]|nr:PAS-domain containing protein [Xanthobacteraceae bacterium]
MSAAPDETSRSRLAALDAIAIYAATDRDGCIVEVNDLLCRLSGYPCGDLAGMDYRSLVDAASGARPLAAMLQSLSRGVPWRGELPLLAKTGDILWIDATATPPSDAAGVVTGFSAIGIDITSRRRAEQALRQSETLLRSTLAALSEGIVVQNAAGQIISNNPAAERILRMTSREMAGVGSEDPRRRAIREDGSEFPGAEHPAMVALATGKPQDQVVMGLKSDGGPATWISINAHPMFTDDSGVPTSVVTSFSDITAHKIAQETLHEAVDAMPDGFVIYDRDDRLVLCNEAYRHVYTHSAPAIRPGVTFRDILLHGLENGQYPEAGETDEERQAWLDHRMRRHTSPSDPVIQQLPDGRWLQIRERRTPAGSIVGFRTDVTDLKREVAKVRAIVDNFPGGISFIDNDLRLVTYNEEFVRLLDLPEELFRNGATTLEMVIRCNADRGEYGPGDPDEQVRSRLALAREAAPHLFERTRPNGTVLEVRGTPVQGGGFITTYTDVTERHAARMRLAESEQRARAQTERLQITLANMSQGLSMFDADGRLMVWNDRYIEIYGLAPDVVQRGVPITTLLDYAQQRGNAPADLESYRRTINRQIVDRDLRSTTAHLLNGRMIQVERTPIPGGGWLAIHEDITEKQQAQDQLRDKAEELARINMRFEAAVTHMSQGICLFDADQKLVICNQRFRDMYDFAEAEVGPGTSLEAILRRLGSNGETSEFSIEEHLESLPGRSDEVFRRADGRVIAIRRRPTPDGGWVATHEDITEREQANQRISHLAYHDALTGLANRAQFKKHGEVALTGAAGRAGSAISVLLIDLDRFKAVNDTFGHAAGDAVLLAATKRMQGSIRADDLIARLGGDEFAIVQEPGGDQREAAIALASRLVDILGAPYEVGGQQAMIGASIGIAIQSDPDDTIEQLMHKADLALYRVKASGRNGYSFYEEDLGSRHRERKQLGDELRSALAVGALDVRYEPIVSLSDQRVCGMEARVHWAHPERGLLEGKAFLDIAEEVGLTGALGEFILRRACLDAGRWPEHVKLTVNIARTHVRKRTLMDTVTRALLKARMAPERLDIAITETNLLQDDEDVMAELHQLRSLGVSVVIDSYGAGNSSLNHLRIFPFDRIKIDRSMIAEITDRPESAAIVCAVTGIARSLDILTTAEGVTTDEQLRMLQAAGCSQAQGGLFGSPGTATETLSRLLIENALPAQQRPA